MKLIVSLFVVILLIKPAFANTAPEIKFIENKGQWDKEVLFRADIPNGHIFVSKNYLTYYLIDKKAVYSHQHAEGVSEAKAQVIKVFFEASNLKKVISEAQFPFPEKYNYFVGNKSTWRSNVRAFKKIVLKNLYDGIDLEILSNGLSVKSNFIVKPYANPNQIKISYEGADSVINEDGNVVLKTWVGNIIEKKPESFQRLDKTISVIYSAYSVFKNTLRFNLGEYDKSRELIIDPLLIFGTYVGAVSDNFGFCSAFNRQGNAFAGGTVYGPNFPRTTGRFMANFAGGSNANGQYARDCMITKFSPDGTDMIWATFLGGSSNEQPHSMVTNSKGELVILGTTSSNNFSTLTESYDATFNGIVDIFVSVLNSNGDALIGSSFLGGSKTDGFTGFERSGYPALNGVLCYNYADWYRGEVIVDAYDNVLISSVTESKNADLFPIKRAFQTNFGGGVNDGLLARFNSNLSDLEFCTYLGGSGEDACYAIICDNSNNLYATGGTTSNNLPFSNPAFGYKGGVDGFILKTNTSATLTPSLIYVGTPLYDQTYLIQKNEKNEVFVIGQTEGIINITPGVYGVSNAKQFIKGFSQDLNTEIISTTFGKPGAFPSLSPSAFVIDKCDRLYFSGWGGNTNAYNNPNLGNTSGLPTTQNAFQKTTDGNDFYLMIFSDGLKELKYASFYGGNASGEHVDGGTSHFDENFIFYQTVCAGCWGNSDFPTTNDAWSKTNPSVGCNIGVFKMDFGFNNAPQSNDTLIYVNTGDTLNYFVNFSDIDFDSVLVTANGSIFSLNPNKASFEILSKEKGLTRAKLTWPVTCKDYGKDTFVVDFSFSDIACPISKNNKSKVKIIVNQPYFDAPFPECLTSITDDAIKIKWKPYTTKPQNFGYLKIQKNIAGNIFYQIDTVADWKAFERIDNNALNHKILKTNYILVSVNNCGTICDTSRIISSIYLGDTTNESDFTGTKDSIINITLTDTLNSTFTIFDTQENDSVYASLTGNLLNINNIDFKKTDGLGSATLNLNLITNCETKTGKYDLYMKVRDNQCPQPREKTKKITINILPINNLPLPDLSCPVKYNNQKVKINLPKVIANKYAKKIMLVRYGTGNKAKILTEFKTIDNNTFYIDNDAINNNQINYSYQTIITDVCNDAPVDSSNKVFVFDTSNVVANKLNWYTVTVKDNKEVKLVWNKPNNDSFLHYNVYKKQDRNKVGFGLISQVASINDTTFTDKDVDVQKHSYCYIVTNSNQCGTESKNNDSACSILLTGISKKVEHQLNWQEYNYWEQGAHNYELLRLNAYQPVWQNILPSLKFGYSYFDKELDYQVGLYKYKVVAYQNPTIGKASSESNEVELIQAPYVYVPNAYTPNGDNLNDVWKVEHAFVKEFSLKIFNRWGELIFETSDKNQAFTLQTGTQLIANDVYVYHISYSGWDGTSKELKGNFTVLK